MQVSVLNEAGYKEAAYGLSKSYNSTIERSFEIMPKLSKKDRGHNKFLESMVVWVEIRASRTFWQEFDTYRVGVTKQSESTMHTIFKRLLTQKDFELPIWEPYLEHLNEMITAKVDIDTIKCALPEGFLQTRVICTNYKALRGIYHQRKNHRLKQWHTLLDSLLLLLEHPEFITGESEDVR